ncbi:hypothetical protein AMTR_s00130p00068800 [Amborella trichopoda]|uniref:Uncharacterized protein n=1 Tax=Amborella trichopoda TaxID=13333 RepID=W1NQF6_AMBTC|nr:hypothetical protein AMTR_s00130p00068800 [Amborella trichopoda]
MLERVLRRLDEMRPHNRDPEGSNDHTHTSTMGGGSLGGVEVTVKKKLLKVEFNKPRLGDGNIYSSKPIPTERKLTHAEARERREKGLCHHCDEKFTPNRKCKTQELFWVEGLLEDEDEEEVVDLATVEVQEVGLGEAPEDYVVSDISLHAIAGA